MIWLRFSAWRIGVHLLVWSLLPLVTTMVALLAGLSAHEHIRKTSALATESREALSGASELLQAVVDLETGVRGYALTSDPAFLEPYERGRPVVASRLAALRDRVDDRPDQLGRLDRVASLVDEWNQAVAVPVIAAVGRGEDVRPVLRQGQGKRRIDAIRAEMASLEATERQELDGQVEADAAAWRLAGILAAVAIVTLVASSIVALLMGYRIEQALGSFARAAHEIAGGSLERRLPDEGRNELAVTGRAINQMAAALADAREELLAQNDDLVQQVRRAENARGEVRAILDAASDAIVMIGPDTTFHGFNRQFDELFGVDGAQLIGRRFDQSTALFDRIFADAEALRAHLTGTSLDTTTRLDERVKQQWPACRDLALLSSPVWSESGEYLGRLYVFRDVTFESRLDEQRRQLEAERARASEVQADLLPRTAPVLPGVQLAGHCIPALQVGGDFFDWYADDGLVWLTLGDVMGKGMAAALLMATVRATLRAGTREHSPAATMALAQAVLGEDLSHRDSYVTLLHAVYEPASGRLVYVDAGHGHALVRRADGRVERLTRRSFPLGMPFASTFDEGEVVLATGDALILYSDGLVDAAPGVDVADLVARVEDTRQAREMVDDLIELAVGSRAPVAAALADDLTVLVLRAEETRQRAGHGDDQTLALSAASVGDGNAPW